MNLYELYNKIINFKEKGVKEEFDKEVFMSFLTSLSQDIHFLIFEFERLLSLEKEDE